MKNLNSYPINFSKWLKNKNIWDEKHENWIKKRNVRTIFETAEDLENKYFEGEYELELSGEEVEKSWEDRAKNLCKNLKSQAKEKTLSTKILKSKTFMEVKEYFKNNKIWADFYKKINRNIDELTYKDINKVNGWCKCHNGSIKTKFSFGCSDQLMRYMVKISNLKLLGLTSNLLARVRANSFAQRLVEVLENFSKNTKNSNNKLLYLFSKSDSLVAPFYQGYQEIVPSAEKYENDLNYSASTGKSKKNVPNSPYFADILNMEIYEEDGKYFVKVFRNWQEVKVCKEFDNGRCGLEHFTKLIKDKLINAELLNKVCFK